MNESNKNISITRSYLKSKILNDSTLIGYENETNQIQKLIERTIENGESNSVLLIGPRCSGKTTLLRNVLNNLNKKKLLRTNSVFVELHGLVHTDDRLALKEMTNQMDLDNAVDGKVFGSFAENLAFLLACLKSGNKETAKSVVIILEEFDLFCNHHNQTLLYNLFDVSQSAQTPLCIIGTTCRLDVIELLEKRVKSRFSHRQIFLSPGNDNNTLELKSLIERIGYFLMFSDDFKLNIPKKYRNEWNSCVKEILDNKKFMQLIQRLIDVDCDERCLKNILLQIINSLSQKKSTLTIKDFEDKLAEFEKDEILEMLNDVTVLELCLLIAMKHHCDIYDNQLMNFEMIYTRYVKFVNANSNIQTVQRAVVMKAFEHIQNMELIVSVSQGTKLQKEYQMFKLLLSPQQILEFVKKSSASIPTEVVQWANSSIV
nr:origin recognition complex subunit 4 [Onthophagus taurus]